MIVRASGEKYPSPALTKPEVTWRILDRCWPSIESAARLAVAASASAAQAATRTRFGFDIRSYSWEEIAGQTYDGSWPKAAQALWCLPMSEIAAGCYGRL